MVKHTRSNKLGPNDPCPCGSGKKFKKCHRGKPIAQKHQVGGVTFGYPRGLAGVPQYVVVRPHFRDPADPRNQGGPTGSPGRYRAVFTLAKPGIPLTRENSQLPHEQLRGDSYLAIAPPAYRHPSLPSADRLDITATTPQGEITFEGIPNDAGFLAQLRCEFEAPNLREALLRASRALAPALSDISIRLDVPTTIGQIDTLELRTETRQTRLITTPASIPLCIPGLRAPSDEFRLYASLYREALNSLSLRYQFLCYYKIAEGVSARRRRLAAAAASQGTVPARTVERMPATLEDRAAWFSSLFSFVPDVDDFILDNTFPVEVLGKKLSYVRERHLRPIRLRIAHAALDSGEIALSPDDPDEEMDLMKWLPLAKCIARLMIRNEFPNEQL